ncbi:esterase/lipase family protein [Zavarzinia compransoris]|uniref:Alpha/beta hydrolase n=1 Tax=Zavarzinia compransoris TaxID=1264899 RepID=A0A317DZB5_9PROT|nr:alpha/beta fold hydrolase [Zavarzinia compransoris]PWR19564.1 alpha/beta hydrolase [Zavarzinia compransoris]TDP40455.1 alpha/beta hydrolase family protein [Zavarzinia compransoris]
MRAIEREPGPPPTWLAVAEVRAVAELFQAIQAGPLMRLAPRGDGHPVLVLPGFLASDLSTVLLRRFLTHRGYAVQAWELGRNLGPNVRVEEGLRERLVDIVAAHGRKVSIIGWSLGGVYAREIAREAPQLIRQIITLGSPIAAGPKSTNAWKLFERLSGQSVDEVAEAYAQQMFEAVDGIPATAIFSKSDGIVAWRGCLEQPGPMRQNIRVRGSHCGLGHNVAALMVIADRLAQPEGEWAPFEPKAPLSLLYPCDATAYQRVAAA